MPLLRKPVMLMSTLFMTWPFNQYPDLYKTCLIIISLVQTNVKVEGGGDLI